MKVFDSSTLRSSAASTKWTPQTGRLRRAISASIGAQSQDPRWMLVQRIVASPYFRRSTLLANFLLFVCDRYLSGQTSEINEKQIGFHVFGRVEGYNASDDNIVRNYARTLRKRLEEYFAAEGKQETLTLLIPRGGYVPVFSPKENESAIPEQREEDLSASIASIPDDPPSNSLEYPIAAELSATERPQHNGAKTLPGDISTGSLHQPSEWISRWGLRPVHLLAAACTIVLSALAGYIGAHDLPGGWLKHETPAMKINRVFWSQIFEEKRDTFIVPADGGLVMLQSFIRQHVSLEDYANRRYLKDSEIVQGIIGLTDSRNTDDLDRLEHKVETIGARRYTSIADLELTTHLARLPEVVPERLMIRYARDLRMDDLHSGNVILMGSNDADPWVDLFQQQLNFRFSRGADFGGSGVITNRHPLNGEHENYASEPNDPLLRTYGVIAFVPNLDGTGHALLIEGVNMAGTQAAGDFLLSPVQMQPVLERARGANGVIGPFEVLIETDNIAANASQPHVVSERIGLP
jgi:hypothetical protein